MNMHYDDEQLSEDLCINLWRRHKGHELQLIAVLLGPVSQPDRCVWRNPISAVNGLGVLEIDARMVKAVLLR